MKFAPAEDPKPFNVAVAVLQLISEALVITVGAVLFSVTVTSVVEEQPLLVFVTVNLNTPVLSTVAIKALVAPVNAPSPLTFDQE